MFKKAAIFVMALLCLALPAAAQRSVPALPETFTAEDSSFSFQYPEGWFAALQDTGVVLLTNEEDLLDANNGLTDTGIVFVFIPPSLVQEAELPITSLLDTLSAYLALIDADAETVEQVTIGERAAAQAFFSPDTFTVFALEFNEGTTGLVGIQAGGSLADFEEIINAVVPTFNTPSLNAETSSSGGQPCMIRTDQERFVAVRVGPGVNRTSIAFLPANTDFEVLGKAEAGDGSLWWKVDKELAAPGKAANETWVAQEDVTASGGCDQVIDADAPPVIPITAPQPTAAPGSGQPTNAVPVTGGSGRGIFIMLPDWHNQLPADLRAASQQASRLTVYVEQQLVTVDSATYVKNTGETTTVYRNRVDFTVRVVITSTGQEIARQTFSGTEPPPFPNILSISGTLNGSPPTFDVVLPWLRGFLG